MNELLQVLDSEDGSVLRTLGNVSTEFPDGIMGPPFVEPHHSLQRNGDVVVHFVMCSIEMCSSVLSTTGRVTSF